MVGTAARLRGVNGDSKTLGALQFKARGDRPTSGVDSLWPMSADLTQRWIVVMEGQSDSLWLLCSAINLQIELAP